MTYAEAKKEYDRQIYMSTGGDFRIAGTYYIAKATPASGSKGLWSNRYAPRNSYDPNPYDCWL